MKRNWLASLIFGVLVATGLLCVQCRPSVPALPSAPSGILLITVDTLRADHLGYYQYPRKTSPFLDHLAGRSTVFLDVSAQIPKTLPSLSSMMTSRYPESIGVLSNRNVLPPEAETLAEVLRDSGFRSIGFTSNGNLIDERGIAQGFDEFTFKPWAAHGLTTMVLHRFENPLPERFFIWVHYNDPHGTYRPPGRFDEMFLDDPVYDSAREVRLEYEPLAGFNQNFVLGAVPRYQRQPYKDHPRVRQTDFYIAQYDAEIRATDAQLRRLMNTLESSGKLDNVLVVITADHGEGLGEHDFYFEHGWFAYQGQVHVPLIIHHPGQETGRVVTRPAALIDLAPTILDILQIPWPESFRGQSLVPLESSRNGETGPIHAVTPDVYPHQYRSLRQGRWKYIVDEEGREELYNLAADPDESIDLAGKTPLQLEVMREMLQEGDWDAGSGDRKTLAADTLDEAVAENLRALGYLDQ